MRCCNGACAATRPLPLPNRGQVGAIPSLDVYPDRPAPVLRNTPEGRELARLTWGMPTPPQFLRSRDAPDTGVTNIRNTGSPHWRRWLGVGNHCVVPATAFSEYGQKQDSTTKRKPLHWFALDQAQSLFFFAGIWTAWEGTRGSGRTPRKGVHQLFAFLTTEPNVVVKPVHPKAMPVILTTFDEVETWLTSEWAAARVLQRPLADKALVEVERPVRVRQSENSAFFTRCVSSPLLDEAETYGLES